ASGAKLAFRCDPGRLLDGAVCDVVGEVLLVPAVDVATSHRGLRYPYVAHLAMSLRGATTAVVLEPRRRRSVVHGAEPAAIRWRGLGQARGWRHAGRRDVVVLVEHLVTSARRQVGILDRDRMLLHARRIVFGLE